MGNKKRKAATKAKKPQQQGQSSSANAQKPIDAAAVEQVEATEATTDVKPSEVASSVPEKRNDSKTEDTIVEEQKAAASEVATEQPKAAKTDDTAATEQAVGSSRPRKSDDVVENDWEKVRLAKSSSRLQIAPQPPQKESEEHENGERKSSVPEMPSTPQLKAQEDQSQVQSHTSRGRTPPTPLVLSDVHPALRESISRSDQREIDEAVHARAIAARVVAQLSPPPPIAQTGSKEVTTDSPAQDLLTVPVTKIRGASPPPAPATANPSLPKSSDPSATANIPTVTAEPASSPCSSSRPSSSSTKQSSASSTTHRARGSSSRQSQPNPHGFSMHSNPYATSSTSASIFGAGPGPSTTHDPPSIQDEICPAPMAYAHLTRAQALSSPRAYGRHDTGGNGITYAPRLIYSRSLDEMVAGEGPDLGLNVRGRQEGMGARNVRGKVGAGIGEGGMKYESADGAGKGKAKVGEQTTVEPVQSEDEERKWSISKWWGGCLGAA